MRKLKLLLIAAIALMGVNAASAYTVDDLTSAGWTQVTASSITNVNDNYYMLVDCNSSAYVMANHVNSFRPCYKTIANPVENPSFVWILEGSDNEFNLKSYSTGAYFKQASGWNTSMGYARDGRTKVTGVFELSDGKYTLKCKESGSFIGHWNDNGAAVANDGENIAANKAAKDAPGFFLYSISRVTFDAALAESRSTSVSSATKESPADVTSYIQNADWSKDWGGWESTFSSSDNMQWGQQTLESWNATNVIVKQELRGVPNGTYRLTADVISGPGATKAAYIYGIGTSKVSSSVVSAEASAGNYNTMSSEVAGKTLTADNIVVGNNTITIGLDQSTGWIVADNFKLYYLGVDLTAFIEAYNTALTTAQNYEGNLFDEDWATLNAVITANTLNTASATQDQLTTATANLNAANAVAAVAAAKYTTYTTANTLINGGENVDLTSLIVNPSFENGLTGWTNTGGMVTQGNTSFGKTGSNYCEYWQPNGTKGVSQTIAVLPAGLYSMTVRVKARGVTSAKVFAAGIDQAVTIADAENEYTVNFALDDKTEALIGFEGVGTGAGSSWLALDNFRLNYVGALPASLTAATGKMNATVSAAQTSAVDAYNSNQTVANYNAAQAAIAAAEASKDAYEHLGAAITKIDAALAAATTATETDDEAYQTIKTAYNNGTIENADIQTNINNAYDAVIAIIKSQTATSADFTMAIKNQSFEYGDMTGWTATASSDTGIRETSNATYAATGTDGYYLFNTYWQGVPLTQAVTGLPNGQYTLTASVASDGATIYLIANGEHNEGIETAGEYPSKDVMQETTFTFLVKDGTATIGVVGGADGTAGEHKDYVAAGYWWYKADNFRLQKNRDLTPEEAAIVPEDLSIPSTATVFINKTTTLVPTSTTEDASIEGFVNWTSDNTSVATVSSTGVVTAVAYGTANITVTSTLNAQATATCAVTVTAPLYSEAENLDFAEGPVATTNVVTYDKDKGTGKAQMQEVTGWTIVSNGDARAAAVFEYNSGLGLGNAANTVPASGPDGTNGYVLGLEAVWNAALQYTQPVRLPAGAYTITLPIYNQAGTEALKKNLIGFVEDGGTEHFAKTTNYTVGSWTTETIKFEINEEAFGKLSLGVTVGNYGNDIAPHLFIDRMTIAYEPFATAADYAALNAAIEAKDGKTLGFDEGEYAPYNNAAVLQALAAAKAIDQEANNVQSTVQAATAALEAATWTANATEVNAIYDGDFAIQIVDGNNTKPLGWNRSSTVASVTGDNTATQVRLLGIPEGVTASNKGMMTKFHSFYGEDNGYTLPLKAETTYKFTFKYGGWNDCNNTNAHLNIYDPTGAQLSVNLPKNFNTPDKNCHESAEGWHDYEGYFTTTTAGNYVIGIIKDGGNSSQNQFGFTELELKKAVADEITIAENTDYTPALKYANVTFNRTLVAGWNGLVLPFDMTVKNVEGKFSATKVKNFTGISYDEAKGVTLNFDNFDSETTVIPAGTPFLVKTNSAGTSYTINGVVLPANGLQNITKTADGNDNIQYTMKGTHAASTNLTNVSFALIQGNTFFYHDGAAQKESSAKAFRAYFENESEEPAAARVSFDFGDDVVTGITELAQPKTAADGTAYDLQGRKVETFKQKGIYIVNGRKVVK